MLDEFEEDCWVDRDWLSKNQLSIHNVTEYFKLSPYYQTNILLEKNSILKIQVEEQGYMNDPNDPTNTKTNFIITKCLEDDNNRMHVIGLYRIFDSMIFKRVNLKQFIQNQISSVEANIDEIAQEVKKKTSWNDLKKQWNLKEVNPTTQEQITLKEELIDYL